MDVESSDWLQRLKLRNLELEAKNAQLEHLATQMPTVLSLLSSTEKELAKQGQIVERNLFLETKNVELEHLAIEMPTLHSRLVEAEHKFRHINLSNFNPRIFEILALLDSNKPLKEIVPVVRSLKSQLGQDLLALVVSEFKNSGFFVEIGATDGVSISNTYLLENNFNWHGILAEPARMWHSDLLVNRSCKIDTRCVWSESNKSISFTEAGEFSTIQRFESGDEHEGERRGGSHYEVFTVSLRDLLTEHEAPTFIDFLSVDTEGSEYEILKDFDFNYYKFGLITVEHNKTASEGKIEDLLTSNGYLRILSAYSEWDSWYVQA